MIYNIFCNKKPPLVPSVRRSLGEAWMYRGINKQGFTLIESLIYIAGATLMFLLTASFVSNVYLNSTKNIKYVDRYFEIYRAHDFVVSFLQSASIDKNLWKKLQSSSFIWTSEKLRSELSFYVDDKNRLLKKTGNYNSKNSIWLNSGYSILAHNCELEFVPVTDFASGNIMGANLILKDKNNNNISAKRFIKFCVGKKL